MFKRFFLFFGIISLSSANLVFAEIHITQSISGVYYHVDGNTARFFYPPNDVDYLYEGSVDFNNAIINNKYELFGNINYRATDDNFFLG
jgi:hypothetical protein